MAQPADTADPGGRTSGRPAADVLTFLIADVRGYTRFTSEHGDEAAARLAQDFASLARESAEARGGSVIELRGDEVLAVFGSARQAIRAATELQEAIADEDRPGGSPFLPIGIGLDAGEAVPVEGGYRGEALNLAARLCALAGPGEVIASAGVVHLARPIPGIAYDEVGPVELKGMARPISAVRVTATADPLKGAHESPFEHVGQATAGLVEETSPAELRAEPDSHAGQIVGREREMWWLRGSWRLAQRGKGRVVFLSGPDGSGRTRLAAELAQVAIARGAGVWYVGFGADEQDVAGVLRAVSASTLPSLVVMDDLDLAGDDGLIALERLAQLTTERSLLVVATYDDASLSDRLALAVSRLDPNGDGHRELAPISAEAVAAIAELYTGRETSRMPVAAIREASRGRPGLVHELASEWATNEATRRLGTAAGRTASGRRELHAMEAELASNIVDLQLVRERQRRSRAIGDARSAMRGQAICPYKGLASFQTDDAEFYFGRERLIAELVARLVGATFLAVVGPSGSGKSSALRAGLLPALAAGVLPGSAGWPQIVMRPGDHPLAALERVLPSESAASSLDGVIAALPAGGRLILAIDQFEEVFTQAAQEERDRFIDLVATAARDPERRVIVILAIRADFYGRCAAHTGLVELMGSGHVLVGPMRADEFARAIELPAEAAGLRIEPELTAALVADVLDEPGGLPLLSTALLELWQHRDGRTLRVAAYQETGGVRGAVARLAEEAYARLEPDQQSIARGILLRLAAPEEGDIAVRRRAPLVEFDAVENVDVSRVLSVLADSRLVTISEGTVEVAHEALLREWPRLANWLEDDAEGRRLRRHLIEAAKEWNGSGRDPGELYRGARLASALDWTTEHNLELNELERAFVNDSRSASEQDAVRTRRTNRRLRVLLAGAVGFLAIALAAGAFAFVQQAEAERAAQTAQEQRAAAERSALRADAQRLGAQALTEEDLGLSLLLARQAVALDDSPETRGTLLAALLRAPGAISVLHGTGDRTNWIDISPDGKVVVAGDHLGALAFFDAERFEPLGELRIGARFGHAFSPDGGTLAVNGNNDGPVLMLIDVATRTLRVSHPVSPQRGPVDLITYSRDGSMLANVQNVLDEEGAETSARVLAIFDPETAAPTGIEIALRPKPGAPGSGWNDNSCSLAGFGGQEFLFSTCAGDPDVRGRTDLIDAVGTNVSRSFPVGGLVAVAPDDARLAITTFDGSGSVIFLDVGSGVEHPASGGHDANIQGIGFAPDGDTLVTVGDDRDVLVWDVDSRAVRERLHGHGGRIFGPAFTPDGRTVFTASLDGTIIAWDLGGDRRLGRAFTVGEGVNGDSVHTVDVSPDGATLAVGLKDGVVRLIDLAGAIEPRDIAIWDEAGRQAWLDRDPERPPFGGDETYVSGLAFSPDGTTLAVGTDLPPVNLIDVASGSVTHFELGHDYGWVNSVTWSKDGTVLVTAGDDGTVRLWDPVSRAQTDLVQAQTLEKERGVRPWLTFATLTDDGATLAVSQSDGSVSLWDVAGHRELHRMQADIFSTSTVRFSPDGRQIVTTGHQSGDIVIWDVETGKRLGEPLDAHAGFSLDAVFASAGSVLASSGSDGIVRLWDVASGRPYGTPLQSTAQGSHGWLGTAVTGDGNTLIQVNLGGDGNAVTWTLDSTVWSERACVIAGRNLSEPEWAEFLPGRPYDPACTAQTPLAREVRLILTVEVPANTDEAGAEVHIAGTLDRVDGGNPKWDPAAAPLTRVDATHWRIELTGAENTRLDYVFTLGSWATKEADASCAEVQDREVILDYGQSGTHDLAVAVANWSGVAPCSD